MDNGHFLLGNQGTQLLDQGHQGLGGLFIAHLHVERLAEHLAVPRHIHLRNQKDVAQAAVFHQLLKLLLRVKLARHARIIPGIVQLRINFGFQPPAGILRKMEVVNVQLKLRHGIQLPCNQRQRHVIASHIVHEPADFKIRPVHDVAGGNGRRPAAAQKKLLQRFHAVIESSGIHRRNECAAGSYTEGISLLLQLGIFRAGFHIPLDEFNGKRPVRSHLHAVLRQKRFQFGNNELHLFRIGSPGRRRSQNAYGLHGNGPVVPAQLLGFGNQRRPVRRKQPVIGPIGRERRGRILPPCSGASHAHPCKR